jgi:hypothetical protein
MNVNPVTEELPSFNCHSQIPTLKLFCFNSLKQCLEITSSKTLKKYSAVEKYASCVLTSLADL